MVITLPGHLACKAIGLIPPGGLPTLATKTWFSKYKVTKTWVLISKGASNNALEKEKDVPDGHS